MHRSTKILFSFTAALIINHSTTVYPQDLPNYPERSFQTPIDSLSYGIKTGFYDIEATEGYINPDEYFIGPGDKIFVSISGVREIVHHLVVNQEGWLYIPDVGGINLRNNSLAKTKEEITSAINRYYKDVKIFISLVDFRRIRISLTGDVVKPSNYVLSANSRLMDLIASAGLNSTANLRNIRIVSKDGRTSEIDFLSFLRFGDFDYNPILREGDVIIVDRVDKVVRISGLVKYPATYEYLEGESVMNLIRLAGGFLSKAKTDTIEIVSFLPGGREQESTYYSSRELGEKNIILKNRDHIIVREIPDFYIDHYVKLEGYVTYPGWYKIIKEKTTLLDIIEEAGGFMKEASLTEATLTRIMEDEEVDPEFERLRLIEPKDMLEDEYDYFKAKSRQRSGRVVVDFVDLFINGKMDENIVLRKNDRINIPEQKNYIIMLGQFVNPGKIVFNENLVVDDYVQLAGGFGWRALEDEVRIIKAKTGEWIDADEVDQLKPGDTIWVPEDPPGPKFWEVFMDGLQILAQVAAIVAAAAALVVASR